MSVPAPDRSHFIQEVMRLVGELLVLFASEGLLILPAVASEPPAEEVPEKVPEVEVEILGLLGRAERPLKGRTVAARLGRAYSSHLRETLAGMVRRGKLARGPKGGYWPAGKPPPACDLDD